MLSVFRQSLFGYRTGIGLVSFGLFAISLLIVYTFDAFGGIEGFKELLEAVPESMKALLKASGGFATSADGYLSTQYRHPFYLVATAGFVIAVVAGAMAREIERGTVLMVLAAPIARWRYLLGKMLALFVGLLVLMAGAIVGTWLGVVITGLTGDVHMEVLLQVELNLLLLALAIAGVVALVSSLSNDGGQVVAVGAGIAVTMFFLDFLAAVWGPAEPLGPFSVYHYYDPLKVAEEGLPWRDLSVLLGVAVVGLGGAFAVFQRRDISR